MTAKTAQSAQSAQSAQTRLSRRAALAGLVSVMLIIGCALSAVAAEPVPVPPRTTITCDQPQIYTGKALTPCTATVTATDGSQTWTTPVTYDNNVNAGTAKVTAGFYDPTGAYDHSETMGTFTIDRAHASVTFACPAVVAYTGTPREPCSAQIGLVIGTQPVDIRLSTTSSPEKRSPSWSTATRTTPAGTPARHSSSASPRPSR